MRPLDVLQVALEVEAVAGVATRRRRPRRATASPDGRSRRFSGSVADSTRRSDSSATARSITFSSSRTLPGQG